MAGRFGAIRRTGNEGTQSGSKAFTVAWGREKSTVKFVQVKHHK